MRRRSLLIAIAGLVGLAAACDALAVTFTFWGPSSISSDANDQVGSFAWVPYEITSIPASGTLIAVDGQSHSASTFSFSSAGLVLTFDHSRHSRGTLALDAYGATFVRIRFSPSDDVAYAFDGAYSTAGETAGWTALDVAISNTQTGPLYRSRQESFNTPAETFILGGSGDDTNNILVGSPTGTLIAARKYDLDIGIFISAERPAATTIAHGTGYVTMSLVPVPEPSTGLLRGAGIVALAAVPRRG